MMDPMSNGDDMYGQAEHDQHEMDRGRDQQDREEHERERVTVEPEEEYDYSEDVAYEGTEHAEFDW